MPLRRRPEEPSPRLRALLTVRPDPPPEGAAAPMSALSARGQAGRPAEDDVNGRPEDDAYWTPTRTWLAAELIPLDGDAMDGDALVGDLPDGDPLHGDPLYGDPLDRDALDDHSLARHPGERSSRPGRGLDRARLDRVRLSPRDAVLGHPPAHVTHPRGGRHRRSVPRLLTMPAALTGARVRVPRAAVVGLLVVVLAAVGIFGVRVAMARAEARPQAVGPTTLGGSTPAALTGRSGVPAGFSTAPAGPSGPPSGGPVGGEPSGAGALGGGVPTGAPGSGALRAAWVVVHVVGQVARPGVVQLPAGSRVTDAITRAGGPTRTADLAAVNLARLVVDGEQIRVPKPGEQLGSLPGGAGAGGAGGGGAGGTGGSAAGGGTAVVNLNTADLAALDTLPGVGPVLAQRILDWRSEHGSFTSVDELAEVSGIGEKIFAQLQTLVAV